MVVPGHPGGHAVVQERIIDVPPGRGLPLTQRGIRPDHLSFGQALGCGLLAVQREERAPDVYRAEEITPALSAPVMPGAVQGCSTTMTFTTELNCLTALPHSCTYL